MNITEFHVFRGYFDCTILYKCAHSIINRKQFIVFSNKK